MPATAIIATRAAIDAANQRAYLAGWNAGFTGKPQRRAPTLRREYPTAEHCRQWRAGWVAGRTIANNNR